jgi:hypothetical protein
VIARARFAIRGQNEVVGYQQMLVDLAARCGQDGAMDQLQYHLSSCSMRAKVPHLLVLSEPGQSPYAAVLLYEYRIGGISTGVFIPSDFDGARTVLAPEHLRCLIARQAAEFLIDRGALLVLLSVSNGDFSSSILGGSSHMNAGYACTTQTRTIRRTLELESTYEATLAKMGNSTRRGLRRHSRRVEEGFDASFVVQPEITDSEFLFLNRNSAFPVSKRIAIWRIRKARQLSNSVLLGLRAADGRWLSVVAGRRQGDLTEIDWQSNLNGLDKYSLVSAIRAHVLQYEINRGTRFLRFDNGTSHSMHLYFRKENVGDLLLVHPLLTTNIARRVLPRLLPRDNHLSKVVREGGLAWHSPIYEART